MRNTIVLYRACFTLNQLPRLLRGLSTPSINLGKLCLNSHKPGHRGHEFPVAPIKNPFFTVVIPMIPTHTARFRSSYAACSSSLKPLEAADIWKSALQSGEFLREARCTARCLQDMHQIQRPRTASVALLCALSSRMAGCIECIDTWRETKDAA